MEINADAPGDIPLTVTGKIPFDPVPTLTVAVPVLTCAFPQTNAGFQLVMLTVKPSTVEVEFPNTGTKARPRGVAVAVAE